jgi:hypothetical protein
VISRAERISSLSGPGGVAPGPGLGPCARGGLWLGLPAHAHIQPLLDVDEDLVDTPGLEDLDDVVVLDEPRLDIEVAAFPVAVEILDVHPGNQVLDTHFLDHGHTRPGKSLSGRARRRCEEVFLL